MRLTHRRHRTHPRAAAPRPATRQDHRPIPAAPASAPHGRRRAYAPSGRPSAPMSSLRRGRRSVILLGLVLTAMGLLLTGSVAHAETVQYVALAKTLDEVISNIRTWIVGVLAGVVLVFLTVGGLRYLMAAGDPGEIEKAKAAFKAAGIGFILAALAPIVVEILKTIVGGV